MTELLSLPWYMIAVPACAVVAAMSVSKILNISRMASFLGAVAPLALPYSEINVKPNSLLANPHVQVVSGWGVMLTCAIAWVALRVLLRSTRGPLGLARMAFSALLLASATVVVLLVAKPEVLSTYAPDWRSSGGGLLLAASVGGVALYFVRLFKSAALLVLCSVASCILASQVFFSKMPYELGDEELRRIGRALPASVPRDYVESGMKRFVRASSATRKALRTTSSDDIES